MPSHQRPSPSSTQQGNPLVVQAVDGSKLLAEDYVVLRYCWTCSLSSSLPGDLANAHLLVKAPGGSPVAMPVPLSRIGDDKELSFDDVLAQAIAATAAGGASMAATEDAATKERARNKKGGKKKKKGCGGGASRPPASSSQHAAVDEHSQEVATLDDLVRHLPAVGPLLDVSLLHRQSPPFDREAPCHGPMAVIGRNAPSSVSLQHPQRFKCELLAYVRRQEPFACDAAALVRGVIQAWARARACAAQLGEGSPPLEVLSFHAHGPGCPGSGTSFPLCVTWPLTLVAPTTDSSSWVPTPGQEDDNPAFRATRRVLHTRLRLPLNRPVFRSTCALRLDGTSDGHDDQPAPQRLANVHLGVPPSGIAGGRQHLVDGAYLYYHYLQDRVDDKGWGCAYRSLQTLVSFFRLNHYTSQPVPSHQEIQQLLVDIGDKPAGFVGSRDWIGSMEVGFYLNQVLQIEWRNVSAPTGPDLADRARELAAHFDTQGTPVMMGGGSLAFTLLGVDWNETTGEVALLILDPHYTGAEDLATVQTKEVALEGYRGTACGWRSPATFSTQSFHNLCLPQRPDMF